VTDRIALDQPAQKGGSEASKVFSWQGYQRVAMGSRMDVGIAFGEGLEGDFWRLDLGLVRLRFLSATWDVPTKKAGQRGPAFLLWISGGCRLIS
jgi:hypothetical protein